MCTYSNQICEEQGMSKVKVFKQPYIAIETSDDELHYMLGLKGELSSVIKVVNNVQQYSGDPKDYESFHSALNNIITVVGEGHIIQKLDVLAKGTYDHTESEDFLQKSFDDHFKGRSFNIIHSFVVITRTGVTKGKIKNDVLEDFKSKIYKVIQTLEAGQFSPTLLREKQLDNLYYRVATMDFVSKGIILDNFSPSKNYIEVGEKIAKSISLVDIDRIDLPEKVVPFTSNGGGALKNFPMDTMHFLHNVPHYDTIIYNQVVEIPNQMRTTQKLQLKQKRHSGIPDPENDICVEDIERLLTDVARENQMLVKAHFNIIVSAENEALLKKAVNFIDNSLFIQGIYPSRNTYNQLELFRSALPGNAVELKDYDLFLTTSDAALCYFFKEALPISEPSPKGFKIRFTDRQGIPISIDPADHSKDIGRINNRNKFILGPSGSGKSFFMNYLVEQYLMYNMHVVIVDTGDSYSGLSHFKNGKYITYKEDQPITMNPFQMKQEEFNIEKKNFLKSLIALIWKGADGTLSQVEEDMISNVLTEYYSRYFSQKKPQKWIEDASLRELEQYLEAMGVNLQILFEEAKGTSYKHSKWEGKDYYSILSLSRTASPDEVKQAYRNLVKVHHPDKSENNVENADFFVDLVEAYETLNDPIQRQEYDRVTQIKTLSSLQDVQLFLENNMGSGIARLYTEMLRKKALEFEDNFKVKTLDFNSFYEFSLFFIPIIIRKSKVRFDIDEYAFVLEKFYKGGEFETTLNEAADSSLFDERLIVFEIDNIKDNKILFPIVTLIVMDVFIQKMRFKKFDRKALIIEEAWKAISSPIMAPQILYLYKTARKWLGEVMVVTQELDDIISNAVVKESIINNSDTFCLLDQSKFRDNYDKIANVLSLNEVEKKKIFTINNLDNKNHRSPFKEVYIKRGSTGEVYGVESSLYQYLTYTTEKPEKTAVLAYVDYYGTYPIGLEKFVNQMKRSTLFMAAFVVIINNFQQPLTDRGADKLLLYIKEFGTNSGIRKYSEDFQKSGMQYTDWIESTEIELAI